MKRRLWNVFLILVALGALTLLAIFIIDRYIRSITQDRIQTSMTEIAAEEPKRIAIVFGARVSADGSPSNSLYDRVLTAVELRRAGLVTKLLMSGDRAGENYDEPAAMKAEAIDLGVPESDIFIDNDGKSTIETCQRAKEIFEIKRAILVTQDYHLPRAIYLCTNFGIDSIGITANRRTYTREDYNNLREFFSRTNAWVNINVLPLDSPKGAKTPIEP